MHDGLRDDRALQGVRVPVELNTAQRSPASGRVTSGLSDACPVTGGWIAPELWGSRKNSSARDVSCDFARVKWFFPDATGDHSHARLGEIQCRWLAVW